jgi:hypothetical protein
MTKALLVGTLHADDPLTSAVYRLLFRQLSYKTEISLLAGNVKIFPHSKVIYFFSDERKHYVASICVLQCSFTVMNVFLTI